MGAFYIERRVATRAITKDIVHHLYSRGLKGSIAIITKDPASLKGSLRKDWLKLMRMVLRERASTLRPDMIRELARTMDTMQSLVFTTKRPAESPEADVFFIDVAELVSVRRPFSTVYLTCPLPERAYFTLEVMIARGGLLVQYE